MLELLHYQENEENKGSQMGHTRKKVDVKIRRKFLFNIQQFDKKTLM
jgi:hypothetical protein